MAYVCLGVSFCKIDLEIFCYFHHIIIRINFIYKINDFLDIISPLQN